MSKKTSLPWGGLLLTSFSFLIASAALPVQAEQPLPKFEELEKKSELPDPFTSFETGKKVDWDQRREELKRLFQHYVYGYLPPKPAYESTEVTQRAPVMDGRAQLIEISHTIGPDKDHTTTLHIALFVPTAAEGPVPVFLAVNKCGNVEVIPDEAITRWPVENPHSGCKNVERGNKEDYWALETIIDRGYGFATMHVNDIDPDMHDFSDGVHALYDSWFDEQGIPQAQRWGTVAAWAWGLHRGIDVLEKQPEVNAKQIALTGHSRRGKTALFAAAMDERVALVVPHQSGTGGMALNRNNDQETVKRITTVFPHWFNDAFDQFGDNEEKLPIDQHLLIAVVAPRPLMETSGLQDTWANFESSFQAIQAASPVYEALGVTGLKMNRPLTADDKISSETAGHLLQYRLDTKHVLNADYWEGILDFADLHFQDEDRSN